MHKKPYTTLLILLFLAFHRPAASQVIVNFVPAVYGQTLEGLFNVQLSNTGNITYLGNLTIRVSTAAGDAVVAITIPGIQARPGMSPLNRAGLPAARMQFGSNYAAGMLAQTGRFAEGTYEYCFELEAQGLKQGETRVFENCYEYTIEPLTPLLLVDPGDGETTCNKRPVFTWQPSMPVNPATRYRLLLTEVRDRQEAVEALRNNLPLINEAGITQNMLLYPPHAPELREGKTYAWQVTAYSGKTVLTRSEIWTLTIHCEKEESGAPANTYRELAASPDGGFYMADGYLRFSFRNPYQPGKLRYTITDLAAPGKPVKGLPELEMNAGINKYDLNLGDYHRMKDGHQYVLEVTLVNKRTLTLRFIYKQAGKQP